MSYLLRSLYILSIIFFTSFASVLMHDAKAASTHPLSTPAKLGALLSPPDASEKQRETQQIVAYRKKYGPDAARLCVGVETFIGYCAVKIIAGAIGSKPPPPPLEFTGCDDTRLFATLAPLGRAQHQAAAACKYILKSSLLLKKVRVAE